MKFGTNNLLEIKLLALGCQSLKQYEAPYPTMIEKNKPKIILYFQGRKNASSMLYLINNKNGRLISGSDIELSLKNQSNPQRGLKLDGLKLVLQ